MSLGSKILTAALLTVAPCLAVAMRHREAERLRHSGILRHPLDPSAPFPSSTCFEKTSSRCHLRRPIG